MEFWVVFFKLIKHLLQMLHVIMWTSVFKNDVINVALREIEAHQHSIHNFLEFYKGVLQAKRQ
jgi:hypothetical protein